MNGGREARHLPLLMVAFALASLLAYVRDAAIGSFFGNTAQTDAYFVGTFIPTLFSALLVTESLVPAFLPTFARYVDDPRAAGRIASATITVATLVLGLVSIAIFGAAKSVVHVIAPTWDGPQLELATTLLRMTCLSTVAVGIGAILGAMGNARHRYLAPPLGLAISNATVAATTIALAPRLGIFAPAWGMVIGSVLYLLVQILGVFRTGFRFMPAFTAPESALRRIGLAMVPMVLFSTLAQTMPVVERWLGSTLPAGQLSYLSYALKLMQVPVSIISVSSSLVSFVEMSRNNAEGDVAALRQALGRGARLLTFLLLMASVAICWLARPLVDVTLHHGRFTTEDTTITATLLAIYATAIVPAGLGVLLTRSHQARGKYWVPFRIGLLNIVIYIATALLFFDRWGIFGLAAAFPVSQVTGVLLLQLQQPPTLRTLPRGAIRHVLAMVAVAGIASAATVGARELAAAGASGLPGGTLIILIAGGLTTVASSLLAARFLGVAEGAIVETWLRDLALRPFRAVGLLALRKGE